MYLLASHQRVAWWLRREAQHSCGEVDNLKVTSDRIWYNQLIVLISSYSSHDTFYGGGGAWPGVL